MSLFHSLAPPQFHLCLSHFFLDIYFKKLMFDFSYILKHVLIHLYCQKHFDQFHNHEISRLIQFVFMNTFLQLVNMNRLFVTSLTELLFYQLISTHEFS